MSEIQEIKQLRQKNLSLSIIKLLEALEKISRSKKDKESISQMKNDVYNTLSWFDNIWRDSSFLKQQLSLIQKDTSKNTSLYLIMEAIYLILDTLERK